MKVTAIVGLTVFVTTSLFGLWMMACSIWRRPWYLAWLVPFLLFFLAMEKLRPAGWVRFWQGDEAGARARWLRARGLGFWRFVVLWGLAYFGGALALSITALVYTMTCITHKHLVDPLWVLAMFPLVIWAVYPLAGIAGGAALWAVGEWKYETDRTATADLARRGAGEQ